MESKYTAMQIAIILAGNNHPLSAYNGKVVIYADYMGDLFERIPKELENWNFSVEDRAFVFENGERVHILPKSNFTSEEFEDY